MPALKHFESRKSPTLDLSQAKRGPHTGTRIAVLEIGTNAIRLILGECILPGKLRVLKRWSTHMRLGDPVFSHGYLPEQQLNRLMDAIRGLLAQLDPHIQTDVRLYATSALRASSNQNEVLQRIRQTAGYPVTVLEGTEEADCLLWAMRGFLPASDKPMMLADLGGGSLELSILSGNHRKFCQSLDFGTLRIREAESTPENRLKLMQSLQDKLREIASAISTNPASLPSLVLAGGNAKTIAGILPTLTVQLENKPGHWVRVSWPQFTVCAAILQAASEAQFQSWKLRPQQTEVLRPALEVFLLIGKSFGISEITLPFLGLKEALLLKMASTVEAKDLFSVQPSVMELPPVHSQHEILPI